MKRSTLLFRPLICWLTMLTVAPVSAATVEVTYNNAADIPVTTASHTASGNTLDFRLNFAPAVGTMLTVVNVTGSGPIQGTYDNLAQGQRVDLTFNGIRYPFFANYFGGSGNDLVLAWGSSRPLVWGDNNYGYLGLDHTLAVRIPTAVLPTGVLKGKILSRAAIGASHTVVLATDGSLFAWGDNSEGQLGNDRMGENSLVPLAVDRSGALAGKTVVSLVAGQTFTLALCSDGTLVTWGGNNSGTAGNGSSSDSPVPTAVDQAGVLAGRRVVSIVAGSESCFALCSDGTLAAWGNNVTGQLGDGSNTNRSRPVLVSKTGALAGKTIIAVASGHHHTYALCSDGTLAAWGRNSEGQLGNNTTTESLIPVPVVRTGVLSGKTITSISCGALFGMALCSDGTLASWGSNNSGQLGIGSTTLSRVPVAVNRSGVLSGKTIVFATAGYNHAHALCSDGTLASWGLNDANQLGDDTGTTRTLPVRVVSTGLRAGERFHALGSGAAARQGLVLAASPPPATPVTLAADPIGDQQATLRATANANGTAATVSFEYGTTTALGGTAAAIPASVNGSTTTAVSANLGGLLPATTYHYRVVASGTGGDAAGETLSFTTGSSAALATLSTTAGELAPLFQTPLTSYWLTVSSATAGISLTPTATQAGAAITVGGNPAVAGSPGPLLPLAPGNNQIPIKVTSADGTTAFTYTVHVTRLPGVFAMESAADVPITATSFDLNGREAVLSLRHAPAPGALITLLRSTSLDPIRGSFSNLAQGQGVALTHQGVRYEYVADYFGGSGNDLVLRGANTRAVAWGSNSGSQLGFATPSQSNSALPVDSSGELSGKTITATAVGSNSSFALDSDGVVYSWGLNPSGQLGTGDLVTSPVPRKVLVSGPLAGKRVVAIDAGNNHALALCSDGTLLAWGSNNDGQLGIGSTTRSLLAVDVDRTGVLAGKTVVQMVASGNFSMALCSDGTIAAWGANEAGQLGDGTVGNRLRPVEVVRSGYLKDRGVVQITAGESFALALLDDGTLAGWGRNDNGHLGDGTSTYRKLPVAAGIGGALAGKAVVQIRAGSQHSLALCSDGTIAGWGANNQGALGNNTTSSTTPVPVAVVRTGVLSGRTVTSIAAGNQFSLASCSDGTMAAWGSNSFGELGNGTAGSYSQVPVLQNPSVAYPGSSFPPLSAAPAGTVTVTLLAFPPPPQAVTLAASSIRDLGATLEGEVNANGNPASVSFEYGLTDSYGTVVTANPSPVAGTALTPSRATLNNLLGGTTYHYRVVASGPGGKAFGADATLTTTTAAALASLEAGGHAVEPAFSQEISRYAVTVPETADSIVIGATAASPGAAVTVNGSPRAPGGNPLALSSGANLVTIRVTSPGGGDSRDYTLTVTRLPGTILLTSANQAPLALSRLDASGQHLDFELRYLPTAGTSFRLFDLAGFTPISGRFDNLAHGQRVTLAFGGIEFPFVANYFGGDGNDLVLQWANTRLFGWGFNTYGHAGLPATPSLTSPTPADPSALLQDKTILTTASGSSFTIMLMSDGSVFGIGENGSGQLGNPAAGSRTSTPVPVDRSGILNGKTVTTIAVGSTHTLALCSDGTLVAWGDNSVGRLGTGNTTRSPVPIAVDRSGALAGKRVIAIGAGTDHSLAACSDGTVVAWGQNFNGQLGNGVQTNSLVPIPVNRDGALAGKTVTKLFGGNSHSIALCSDGSLAAWGANVAGQLGDGTTTNRLLPVTVTSTGILAGKTPAAIAAGATHQLLLCTDGTLVTWGSNFRGQLGTGNTTSSSVPIAVTKTGGLAGKAVTAIAAGTSHSLAVSSDGTGAAWGFDSSGQLGDGAPLSNKTLPVGLVNDQLRAGERFIQVSAGSASELSLGIVASPPPPTATTLAATAIRDTAATLNGAVLPNGSSTTLRFEYGLTSSFGMTVPAVPGTGAGTGAVEASARLPGLLPGTTYHFRLVAEGPGATAFGDDSVFTTTTNATLTGLNLSAGILFPGFERTHATYIATVSSGVDSITVAPVPTHPEAVISVNGTVIPSGGASGPIPLSAGGIAVEIQVTSADRVDSMTYRVAVTRLPGAFTVPNPDSVPLTAGELIASGNAPPFVLGHAPQVGSSLKVIDITGSGPIRGRFDNLAQGQRVGLEFGGVLYPFVANYSGGTGNDLVLEWGNTRPLAWGNNGSSQSGTGISTASTLLVPTPVETGGALAGKTIHRWASGSEHVIALCLDGSLVAWGRNNSGMLGDGTNTERPTAINVPFNGALAGKSVVAVAAGSYHSLALCSDGSIAAWGSNISGQLGNNSITNSLTPVAVDTSGVLAGKPVIAIAAGSNFSLALCQDGTIAAWGQSNSGQLGNNTTTFSRVPVAVVSTGVLAGRRPVALAAGHEFALALCDDGQIAGWGSNSFGQLGDNTTTQRNVPVLADRGGVLAGKTVTAIAAGVAHSLARLSDGTLAAWGSNASGVLGDGTTTNRRVPVLINLSGVLAGKTVTDMEGGGSHTLAVCSDGTLAAWGRNQAGEVGDITTTTRLLPVLVNTTGLQPGERFIPGIIASDLNSSHAIVASPPAPQAASLAASSVKDSGAILNATVRPNGSSATVSFEFGLTPFLGTTLTAEPATLGGSTAQSAGVAVAGLTPGTTYHYRVVSSGPGGIARGEILSFATTTRATLAGLTPSAGVMGPDFDPKSTAYWLTVPAATQGISFTPVVAEPGATVRIAGSPVASGQAGPTVALAPGNNSVEVAVTSADGTANLTYHVTVTRIPESLAFGSAAEVPLRVAGFHATGSPAIILGFAPPTGTDLMLVENSGRGFIRGAFEGLAQGGLLKLSHGGITYEFSVNYHGGDGNDLVLQWANMALFGWGDNTSGAAGHHGPTRYTPVAVADDQGILAGKTVSALSTGSSHTLALCTDGTLAAWGSNSDGQLGNGGTSSSNVPVAVDLGGELAGKTVVAIATGRDHSLVLCSDGTVAAWGSNILGQLGAWESSRSRTPVVLEKTGALGGRKVVAIRAGEYFNLALCEDGTLAAWGYNDRGQLGDGTKTDRRLPVRVGDNSILGGRRISSIAAGGTHVVAITEDGSLFAWGGNGQGQLGNGNTSDSSSPVPVNTGGLLAGKRVVALAAGSNHNLALCADGTLAVWGANGSGQLGIGSTTNSPLPVGVNRGGVLAGKTIRGIAAHNTSSYAVCDDGSIAAWGFNQWGQLGDNTTTNRNQPVLVQNSVLKPGERFVRLADGPFSTHINAIAALPPRATVDTLAAAVTGDSSATLNGSVRANSSDATAWFAYGTTPAYGQRAAATPENVAAGTTTAITASLAGLQGGTTYHFRAVASGSGGISYGESRTFTTGNAAALASLTVGGATLSPAFSPALGSYSATVPFTAGRITVTARSLSAAAEIRINGSQPNPGSALADVDLAVGTNTVEVTVNAGGGTATRNYRITVMRFPESFVYRDGTERPLVMERFAGSGPAPSLALEFAPGPGTGLTVVEQTGLDPFADRFSNLAQGEVVVLHHNGVNYRFVANYFGGSGNDLVLEWANRRIVGWGQNSDGELGHPDPRDMTTPVATVADAFPPDGTLFAVDAAGTGNHTLALGSDGVVYAWGGNQAGQLGNGGTTRTTTPAAVDRSGILAGKRVVKIAAGGDHSLALCEDGTLVAWGSNGNGQLGTGDTVNHTRPVAVDRTGVLAGKTIIAIAASYYASFAVCADGTVAAWGGNGSGMLGNGLNSGSFTRPVEVNRGGVLLGKTVVALAPGENHCFALCSDGTFAAWGQNTYGQLGNNSNADSPVPVLVDRGGVLAGKTVVQVSAGRAHGLAVCSDGTVAGWGRNNFGEVGNNSTTQSGVPVAITSSGSLAGKTVTAVDASIFNSLALCSDGSAATWGYNPWGQLGNGTTSDSPVPVAVLPGVIRPGERIIAGTAAVGSHFALVASPPAPTAETLAATLIGDHTATVNGRAGGNGETTALTFEYGLTDTYGSTLAADPATISGTAVTGSSATLTGLLAGTTYHYRLVASNDGGTTRGADRTFTTGTLTALAGLSLSHGSLAPDFALSRTAYTATVPFTAGSITVSPRVATPGATVTVNDRPVASGGASEALDLAVGENEIVIEVRAPGAAAGSQRYVVTVTRLPELLVLDAAGATGARSDRFGIAGLTAAISLRHAPATGASLLLLDSTGGEPIGGRFANLDQGQEIVLEHDGIAYPFVANYHGGDGNDLVLQWANTRLAGWGSNGNGQLGGTLATTQTVPADLQLSPAFGSPVMAAATGYRHSLALTADGEIHAWGIDDRGQLGQAGKTDSAFPLKVDRSGILAGRRVVAIAAGYGHSLALCDDGQVASWGWNGGGQLGVPGIEDRAVPGRVETTGVLAGKQVVRIAAGSFHNLALCSDGTLAAWGSNTFGQLGNNLSSAAFVPVRVDLNGVLAGKRIVAIAAGYQHSLALCSDGTLAAWGNNESGQLGIGSIESPKRVPVQVITTGALAGKTVIGIAAGDDHSLAWCSDGSAVAWGTNNAGRLGDGTTTRRDAPVAVNSSGALAGKSVTAITAGAHHSLALAADGSAIAWGDNPFGQLGINSNTGATLPTAVHGAGLAAGERFMTLVAGRASLHTLALVASPPKPLAATLAADGITGDGATLRGSVRPNGGSADIAFEYGLTPDYGHRIEATPATAGGTGTLPASARIEGLISGATYHYRILATSPAGVFAGADRTFTAGDDAALASLVTSAGSFDHPFTPGRLEYRATLPFAISSVTVTAVPARAGATVAINGGGAATVAVPAGESTITVEVAAPSGTPRQAYRIHLTRLPETFRFATAGEVPVRTAHFAPAGLSASFELGFAPLPGTRLTVVENTGDGRIRGTFANLAQGEMVTLDFGGRSYRFAAHYFGGDGNDLVLEWASNRLFGWGFGSTPRSFLPTPADPSGIIPRSPIVAVAAGQSHRITLHADGSLAGWGSNDDGQLGNGASGTSSTTPVAVDQRGVLAGKQVVRIAAGERHTLALCSDGTVAGWGHNFYGAIGPAGASRQAVPVAIPVQSLAPGKAVVGIAAGAISSYAWFDDGTIAAWGSNQYGQLGNNSTFNSPAPVLVSRSGALAGIKVVSVVAGDHYAAALGSDGTVASWGRNADGQLGINSTVNSPVPVAVDRLGALGGKTVVALAGGSSFQLARCSDGSVAGWGQNTNRQLATSVGSRSTVPVGVQMTGALDGKTILEIAAGDDHAWARCSDGSVVAWGGNINGQLGDNTTVNNNLPVLVSTANLLPGERLTALASCPLATSSYAIGSLPQLPLVTTLAASAIRNTVATLHGAVLPDGVAGELYFDCGPTENYGLTIAANPASVDGSAAVQASAPVTGMRPGSTWHFRLRLVTPHGSYLGEDRTFTTATDATLASLSTRAGNLTPEFSPPTTRYALTVPHTTGSLVLDPTASVPGAVVSVNDAVPTTPVLLETGSNVLKVQVTGPDSGETFRYLVIVTRLPELLRFDSPEDVPLVAGQFAAAAALPPVRLGFIPQPGTVLRLLDNRGGDPISGRFPGLPHGGTLDLESGGSAYRFVVNYHGGDGNDLVLQWANSRVFGWGESQQGQLGNGLRGGATPTPTLAAIGGTLAGKEVLATATGGFHSLAQATDGTLVAWGSGSGGKLGNGSNNDALAPVAVDPTGALAGKSVIALVPGRDFSVALCDDGTLASWGDNGSGQLGNGTTASSAVPVAVLPVGALAGKQVSSVVTGARFALARCSDGSLAAWGANGDGQLGNGGRPAGMMPVTVVSNGALAGKHVTAITAGESHCLALCEDGTMVAWGLNTHGQLGDNSTVTRPAPVAVDHGGALAGKHVIAIAAGNHHSLALCSDGSLFAWGLNSDGQLGNHGTTNSLVPTPVDLSGALAGKTIRSILAGTTFSLASCTDGTIAAWGSNNRGQLGDLTLAKRPAPVLTSTITLRAGEQWMDLPARQSGLHTVMLAGAPLASAATLAARDITGTRATLQGTVQANRNAVAVSFEYGLDATYGETTAALPASASGIGSTAASARLSGLRPGTTYHFRTVAEGRGGIVRGEDRTFTTLSDNALLAALNVNEGVLGPDFDSQVTTYHVSVPAATGSVTVNPVTVHPRATFEIPGATAGSIALTGQRTTVTITVTAEDRETLKHYNVIVTRLPETFVLGDDGNAPLSVDGFSARGYPAILTLNHAPVPGTILTVIDNTGLGFIHGTFSNLARGQRVALAFDGLAYDFVANYHGGDGNDLVLQWANTRAFGWGLNSHGQLGDGTTMGRLSPVASDLSGMISDKTITAISAGYLHSLALCSDGSVAAWGFNAQGQLGNGTTTVASIPVAVDFTDAAGEVIAISAGPFHNLALRTDGRIAAWGYNNHGQLGTGDKVTYLRPVLVPAVGALAGKQVVAVAAGTYHSFALCADGKVAAWGYNDEGELGDGTTTSTSVPVAVDTSGILAGKSVAKIAAGQYHLLALCTDGTLVSWGYNARGQLGTGTATDAPSPVAVDVSGLLSGRTVVDLAAGDSHSVVRCADGTVIAWGNNLRFQLGNGGVLASSVPVAIDLSALPAGSTTASVSAGRNHNLTRLRDGKIVAWGENSSGQLGNLGTAAASRPVRVDLATTPAGSRAMFVASGSSAQHSLAVLGLPGSRPATRDPVLAALAGNSGLDTDQDGIPDLIELAFGLDPAVAHDGLIPRPQIIDGKLGTSFNEPPGVSGYIYGAECSATLEPGSWQAVPDSGSGTWHEFKVPVGPAPRMFMRLTVTPTRP